MSHESRLWWHAQFLSMPCDSVTLTRPCESANDGAHSAHCSPHPNQLTINNWHREKCRVGVGSKGISTRYHSISTGTAIHAQPAQPSPAAQSWERELEPWDGRSDLLDLDSLALVLALALDSLDSDSSDSPCSSGFGSSTSVGRMYRKRDLILLYRMI